MPDDWLHCHYPRHCSIDCSSLSFTSFTPFIGHCSSASFVQSAGSSSVFAVIVARPKEMRIRALVIRRSFELPWNIHASYAVNGNFWMILNPCDFQPLCERGMADTVMAIMNLRAYGLFSCCF